MFKVFASLALAALVAFQAGSASAETRVYIAGQDGVYVSDSRDGYRDRNHGDRWRDDRRRDDWRGHRPPPPRVVIRERDRHDDYAAGILGFFGGMAVGSALDNGGRIPVIRQPPDRFEPRPVALRPWSPAWYRWCDARYRSFDPRSGTYISFDGRKRFCEAG
ncbi:BA14K family protein [Agrobacterium salinitolerans]|nr:BA14K family protein [Agrobacterium salinitolerans]